MGRRGVDRAAWHRFNGYNDGFNSNDELFFMEQRRVEGGGRGEDDGMAGMSGSKMRKGSEDGESRNQTGGREGCAAR
eukprot:764758-Hanusia_phi.AAC.2